MEKQKFINFIKTHKLFLLAVFLVLLAENAIISIVSIPILYFVFFHTKDETRIVWFRTAIVLLAGFIYVNVPLALWYEHTEVCITIDGFQHACASSIADFSYEIFDLLLIMMMMVGAPLFIWFGSIALCVFNISELKSERYYPHSRKPLLINWVALVFLLSPLWLTVVFIIYEILSK